MDDPYRSPPTMPSDECVVVRYSTYNDSVVQYDPPPGGGWKPVGITTVGKEPYENERIYVLWKRKVQP